MSGVIANCPSCGGQVSFKVDSSFVTVCEYCSSAVARSDRGLEDRGKVIDLIDSQSPLDLWIEGRYNGSRFEIVGRTQVKHAMGGVWDEWYCAFDSGHWGWLAEAQGRYYMSFASEGTAPPYQSLQVGQPVSGLGNGDLVVSEMGAGQLLGAKGEIPYPLEPNKQYYYADLSGPEGSFATLDYGETPPKFFLGKEVTLDELGIAVSAPAREEAAKQVSANALECPNCRGSLELVAPDQTERVGCPYCGALSDVNQGKLEILQILDKERFPDPPLSLGSTAEFEGHPMQICGYMVRSTCWDGEFFYWDEYLLYHPRVGFRWLICSDGHWSFAEPVPVADVKQVFGGAKHKNIRYKHFDQVESQVEFVLGQFYWKVAPGERVRMGDYTAPPYSLSEEVTATVVSGPEGDYEHSEVNWSRSRYIPHDELAAKFGQELLPPTTGTVGLNQPYPHRSVYKLFWALFAIAIVAFVVGSGRNKGTEVFRKDLAFESTQKSESQVVFTDTFRLDGGKNIEVKAYSPVSNTWVYLQFDLINEETGAATFFDLPIEYYFGSDWTEGTRNPSKFLKSVGAGTYRMRIATEREHWRLPATVQIVVREGVMRMRNFMILLGLLLLFPLFTFLHHRSFEQKRWYDSSQGAPVWARPWESE